MAQSALKPVFASQPYGVAIRALSRTGILRLNDHRSMTGHGMNLDKRTNEFYVLFGHDDLLF
jgi:hypothetical protein